MNATKNSATIALNFAEVLTTWLMPGQIEAINAENYAHFLKGKKDVCASGDYCDSNMAMDEAFTKAMGREIDMQNPSDVELWSNAWEQAKTMNFDTVLLGAYVEQMF